VKQVLNARGIHTEAPFLMLEQEVLRTFSIWQNCMVRSAYQDTDPQDVIEINFADDKLDKLTYICRP
jgi:hypothetical protein